MEFGEVLKKYEKVDSFLKRSLPHERYSSVRLIEPCVVVSEDYNKLFKFVVLATDCLYVTENPPRNVKDIDEVARIVDITSVELLNDVPDFLGGDLKYRAHHILITYTKATPNHEHTYQGTSRDVEDQCSTLKAEQTTVPTEDSSPNTLSENDSENLRNSSKEDTYGDSLEQEFLEKEKSRKVSHRSPLVPFNSEKKDVPLHHSCSSLDNLKQRSNVKSLRLSASANAVDLKAVIKNENRLIKSFSGTTVNSSTKEKGLLGTFHDFQKRRRQRKTSKSPGNETEKTDMANDDGKETLKEDKKSFRLDLYMLLDKTVMLAYLRSTWDNCLLNAALKQNKETKSPNSITRNKINSSSVMELFDLLENEITNSEKLENTFVLVNELHTASQRDVFVKKLFWQSPGLFVFMVHQLKYYANRLTSCDASTTNKADQLDSMLLFLECLAGMFRKTELFSVRMKNLKRDKCLILRDLLQVTVSSPETKISKIVRPPEISEAAELLLTGRHREKKPPKQKSTHDIELEQLSSELTKHQVTLLHELFIIAYEAVWLSTEDDNELNICWAVKVVESSESIFRFLKCFVQQIMNVIKMAETGDLSTENTTLLYRLFSVIKTLLKQSPKLRKHIEEYYTEEFRYYVNVQTLTKSLSETCPLTSSTLKLIGDVVHLVTSSGRWRTTRYH